jgi:hypothetical protein
MEFLDPVARVEAYATSVVEHESENTYMQLISGTYMFQYNYIL